jgi:hypothetical protein
VKKPLLALLAAAFLAGCGAPVTTPKPASGETFTAQARTVELQRAVRRMFDLSITFADKNGDKRISFEEAQFWGMPQDAFMAHDTNSDGVLSVAEMATEAIVARYVKHLNDVAAGAVLALDRDGDRKLTLAELSGPGLSVTPAPWQVSPSSSILSEAFAVADRSLDGKLTAAELESMFAHFVANGYGYRVVHSDPMSSPSQR